MRTWMAAAAALVLTAPLGAQESTDPADRMSQLFKQMLQLSDEQTSKVRDILKRQSDEIRSLLTEEQKSRFDEGARMMGGFGRFRGPGSDRGGDRGPDRGRDRGGPPWSGGRGGWLPSTEDLKTQLGLSEDQVAKINAIRDAAREEMRNFFRNRPPGGDPRQQFEEFMQKSRESTLQKIREVLTDEQKPKFDEALKNYQAQQEREREIRIQTRAEENLNHIMEELRIPNAAEAEAIRPLVKKVLDLIAKLENFQREARAKMDSVSRNKELSDEAVGDTLKTLREGQREIEKELAAARKELLDVVNSRQELELIRHGVLK